MNKYLKMMGFYLLILLVIIVAVTFLNPIQSEVKTITYSELVNYLETKEIKDIELNESSVNGTLKDGTEFTAVVPAYVIDSHP